MSHPSTVTSAYRRIRTDLIFIAGMFLALSAAAAAENATSSTGSSVHAAFMLGVATLCAAAVCSMHARRARSRPRPPMLGEPTSEV